MYMKNLTNDVPTTDCNYGYGSPSYDWNVIDEYSFKKKLRNIFNMVSSALANTLGPFGSTTIIEQYGEIHITKDGWQILKGLRFGDQIDNNFLDLLVRISAQVVIRVGDGSTSAIQAADCMLREFDKYKNCNNEMVVKDLDTFNSLRPKDFMDILAKCVDEIVYRIRQSATPINKETFEEIYKLAYIATNGDKTISEMIQNIYKETGNPAIEYTKSKTEKTYFEITQGYKGKITYLDAIFANNESGDCDLKRPYFLMFDHRIDRENSLKIISLASQHASQAGSRLVVIAPNYDQLLMNHIKKEISYEFNQRGTSTVVYCHASLINNLSHELYSDFAMMAGATVITENHVEEFVGLRPYVNPYDQDGPNINDDDNLKYIADEVNLVESWLGLTDECTVGAKTTFISGFINRNQHMYDISVLDATTKYSDLEEEYRTKSIVDIKLNDVKNRLMKLKGAMGIIYVGGASTLEQKANYDLVEDAIKACESSYTHGVNSGGNLVIPYVIKDILENSVITDQERLMFNIISDAFANVFKRVMYNKYTSDDINMDEIVSNCIGEELVCYDLITDTYSKDIINSCITDIEILKASVSIVSLLVSSNQYISISTKEEIENRMR